MSLASEALSGRGVVIPGWSIRLESGGTVETKSTFRGDDALIDRYIISTVYTVTYMDVTKPHKAKRGRNWVSEKIHLN